MESHAKKRDSRHMSTPPQMMTHRNPATKKKKRDGHQARRGKAGRHGKSPRGGHREEVKKPLKCKNKTPLAVVVFWLAPQVPEAEALVAAV